MQGLHRKFPALEGIRVDYSWWGWVDVSHDMMPRIVQPDWNKYDTFHYMYQPANLPRDEFLASFIKVQRAVYSWPNIFKRMAGRKFDWVWLVNDTAPVKPELQAALKQASVLRVDGGMAVNAWIKAGNAKRTFYTGVPGISATVL